MNIVKAFKLPGLYMKLKVFYNVLGIFYFVFMTICDTYLVLMHIIPNLFLHNPLVVLMNFCFTLYCFVNVVGNYTLAIFTSTSIKRLHRKVLQRFKIEPDTENNTNKDRSKNNTKLLKDHKKVKETNKGQPDKETEDKKSNDSCENCPSTRDPNCATCGIKRIPRSHHCILCDECILRRDHHCYFMGVCLGFHNQKYFIIFCYHMMVSGMYCMILMAMEMKKSYGIQFRPETLITLLPVSLYSWSMKHGVSLEQLFFTALFFGTILAMTAAAGFFYWQMAISVRGQTTYETMRGITQYNKGSCWKNLGEVLGPYWIISFFMPIGLAQKGNGVYEIQFERTRHNLRKQSKLKQQ